ncbi:MAG: 50S ribosomal protein L33 [Planctomycetota bacterium]|nr:50S ribosomal protein L33 [Planctomycetota bacterium]
MREWFWLECTECKSRNYRTQREMKTGSKLKLKKYCKFDRKHTLHVERKK